MASSKPLWLALCVALVGCASAPDLTVVCPPVPKTYTPAQETEAAAELRALPPGSALALFMTDYAAMRAAARACHNSPKP